MHRSRFLMALMVCAFAVGILCIPCVAAAQGPDAGSGPGGYASGGSSAGEMTGGDNPAPSRDSGFSSLAHDAGAGAQESGGAAEPAYGTGEDTGDESGLPAAGDSFGDPGPHQAGYGDDGGSPASGKGPGQPQDSGGSGDDLPPLSGSATQHGSAANPESNQEAAGSGTGGPGAGAGPGTGTTRMSGREPDEDNGFHQAGRMGTSAGIIALSGAGGMMRGSDTIPSPFHGDGGVGGSTGEGTHRPPRDPPRDVPPRSVPPETQARIEQSTSESLPRSRGKRENTPYREQETCSYLPSAPVPDSGPGKTLGILFSLFGFRRVRKKNVLENDRRKAVFQAIAEAPGVDAVALSRRLEININTLRYHLAKLLATDKITYLSRPGTVRYYLNQGRHSPFEQILLHYLNAGTAGRIIRLVLETPGMSRKDLAVVLGIAGPSVTRHIQELSSEGLIRNEPDGRASHYFITDEAALLLARLGVIQTGSAGSVPHTPV